MMSIEEAFSGGGLSESNFVSLVGPGKLEMIIGSCKMFIGLRRFRHQCCGPCICVVAGDGGGFEADRDGCSVENWGESMRFIL